MTIGTATTAVLTDIANAIRQQNGTSAPISPLDMPAAIRALDGRKEGEPATLEPPEIESGHMSSAVFDKIADAIREQNGLDVEYRPDEMADAILALTWRPWAIYTEQGGILEILYPEKAQQPLVNDGQQVFEIDPNTPLVRDTDQPWVSVRNNVKKVIIDRRFRDSGVTNTAQWCAYMSALEEVHGIDNLINVKLTNLMFGYCMKLDSVYADEEFHPTFENAYNMFYECYALVGGSDCVVNKVSLGQSTQLYTGEGGIFTLVGHDRRQWAYFYGYEGGQLVVSSREEPEQTEGLTERGRFCVQADYRYESQAFGRMARLDTTEVIIKDDMAGKFALMNLNLWFKDMPITSITGMRYLENVHNLYQCFSGCGALTELDLTGFDPKRLEDVDRAFYSCKLLKTIYADESWKLPAAGVSGSSCFYGCSALVGGNGTAFSASRVSYSYLRIDRDGEPGFLTAK